MHASVSQQMSRVLKILLGLTIVVLCSCKDTTDTQNSTLDTEVSKETPPNNISVEEYGNPAQFLTPRIQFKARLKEEDISTLWSMQLDGSDLRQVADANLLFDGATIVHKPIRSPNNRYVALAMDDPKGFFVGLLDLKEKRNIKIIEGGGVPHFNWTDDSENLIFYADGKHYNYDILKQKLSERETIYSIGLFLLPGNKEFLAMKSDGFWIHDFNGDVKRKVAFDFPESWNINYSAVSIDGKLVFFTTDGGKSVMAHWASIETGELLGSESSRKLLKTRVRPIFSDKPNTLYYKRGNSVRYFNLMTRTHDDVLLKEEATSNFTSLGLRSLYNVN